MMCVELSNRKNVENAIRAFIRAFEGRRDVCLIIKISYMSLDGRESFMHSLDTHKANIFLYDQILPDEIFPQFLNNATHYYSLSRGEGWDLTCVDMGAMNKVIVAPYHTAYTDYLSDDRAYLIKKFKKAPAKQSGIVDVLFQGFNWFEPDLDEAVDVLRASVSNKSEAEIKAKEFSRYIRENLTWDKQVGKLYDILNERFG
jgi:glycosyltransferase involved in cell wall biosynthesis